jgi:hypothetical protein
MLMRPLFVILLVLITTMFSSCEVIEGIFKAGFFTAIILIALVIGLIIWLANRLRK